MYDMDAMKKLDLPDFAKRYYGFSETEKTTANSPHLKHGNDIIICKHHPSGNWTFWSPDGENRGDIVNFVAWLDGCGSYAAMTKIAELAALPRQAILPAVAPSALRPVKSPPSPKVFNARSETWKIPKYSKYLSSRGIPNTLLAHPRFCGSIAADRRCNAVFPHYLEGKICGYTCKNRMANGKTFTMFAKDGRKTIWVSNRYSADNRLVVGEAGIDMLSLARYHMRKDCALFIKTRYCSTDGGWNPDLTVSALKREILSMPPDTVVVAAFDNDPAGAKYTANLQAICDQLERVMVTELPRMKDWNDQLLADIAAAEANKKCNKQCIAMTL